MLATEKTKSIVEKFGGSAKDSGSTEVQVALLTERISELTPHLTQNKKDHSTRRGLMKIIGRRRRLLRYLKNKDEAGYQKLISELGIRK